MVAQHLRPYMLDMLVFPLNCHPYVYVVYYADECYIKGTNLDYIGTPLSDELPSVACYYRDTMKNTHTHSLVALRKLET